VKYGEFNRQLSDCQLLNKVAVPWSYEEKIRDIPVYKQGGKDKNT
jgi:hypothetical protein